MYESIYWLSRCCPPTRKECVKRSSRDLAFMRLGGTLVFTNCLSMLDQQIPNALFQLTFLLRRF